MVSVVSLWLPILISSVFVFIASSVIHMFLGYHKNDFGKLPDEEGAMDALRKFNIPPGNYVMPWAGSTKEIGSPEFKEKTKQGPAAFMTFLPNKEMKMGGSLVQWFIYCVVVGILAAYIAGHAVGDGGYLAVFRYVGCTAFIGYTLAHWQHSIWYKLSWSVTLKNTFDGLVYALLTAGTFGWLWTA
jgi:hypothetical protein